MPEITPKSPELVQAQIAAFTAERVVHYEDRRHIFNTLGTIGLEGASVVTRESRMVEYHKDENGAQVRLPEGSVRTAATAEDYLSFLRSVGGSRYEGIKGRAELLTAYGKFSSDVNRLQEELADLTTRKQHPAFLGNGSNSMVFLISQEGKSYAVRVPMGEEKSASAIDSHLGGAVLSKGIPGLERIVAASYENGVTVAEVMPGKEMGSLTVEDIQNISDEQLGELVDTLVAVHDRGIGIDPKPSNLLYDREAGFGIVDYHSSKVAGKRSTDQTLGAVTGWMATSITNAGFYGKPYVANKTAEVYAHELDCYAASLDVLKRYRTVVAQKLEGEDSKEALEFLDKAILSSQEVVDDYSDPAWVTEQIMEAERRERWRIEESLKPKLVDTGWDLV
jgi:hypothetical protein